MYNVLTTTNFNLVAGRIGRFVGGTFVKRGRVLHIRNRHTLGYDAGYPIYECVINFFMAETGAARRIQWDSNLKRREHADFFLRGRRSLHITAVNSFVRHRRTTGDRDADIRYGQVKRSPLESDMVLRKWEIDEIRWQ